MAAFDPGVKGCPKCGGPLDLVDQSEERRFFHIAFLKCAMQGCQSEWVYKRELSPKLAAC